MKFFSDMFKETPGELGGFSHTKLWSNIGMASMTAVFLRMGFFTSIPEWYAWIYATVVVAPQLISKLITLRWGIAMKDEDNTDKRDKLNE